MGKNVVCARFVDVTCVTLQEADQVHTNDNNVNVTWFLDAD